MRYSQAFGKTFRSERSEVDTESYRLMLKTGMVTPVASGIYSYMPLALRSIQKIESIIRSELNVIGAQEIRMPALQPQEVWDQTGRSDAFGENLFRFTDRHSRNLVLGPTHEELITLLVAQHVQSYRDLPLLLYQIQTKFRDEARPRGGLIRVREFDMKDAYSFDIDEEGLAKIYNATIEAYKNIFKRCGLPAIMVDADSGAIGGKDSQEFILPSSSGEDTVITCEKCSYAANAEKASFSRNKPAEESLLELEEAHTPNLKSIEELASHFNIDEAKTLKTVVYSAGDHIVIASIRGDLQVNEVKLKNLLNTNDLRMATDAELSDNNLTQGYTSPIGQKKIKIIADDSILSLKNFVAGANKPDYHYLNANYPRDFTADVISDIAQAENGFKCPECTSTLKSKKGIELGHVFKLGTSFSSKLGAMYLDNEGQRKPIVMGCYGIGIGRLLAGAVEHNHDDHGIIFPPEISPYQVYLCTLSHENTNVAKEGELLYKELTKAKIETFFDDRTESPGVKLNDADLVGFPIRVIVSPRSIKSNSVEITKRNQKESVIEPIAQAVKAIHTILDAY